VRLLDRPTILPQLAGRRPSLGDTIEIATRCKCIAGSRREVLADHPRGDTSVVPDHPPGPLIELHASEHAVEWPRDAVEVECLHEEHGVLLLAVPHEAVQLFLERLGAVRGLLLVRLERP
jgi:hypothetical protein